MPLGGVLRDGWVHEGETVDAAWFVMCPGTRVRELRLGVGRDGGARSDTAPPDSTLYTKERGRTASLVQTVRGHIDTSEMGVTFLMNTS